MNPNLSHIYVLELGIKGIVNQMKRFNLLLSLFLVLYFPVIAQKLENHGLVISGSVSGVETECLAGKPFMRVRLFMQFRNDGNVPLFLIMPSPAFNRRVHFTGDKLGESHVSAKVLQYNPYFDNPFGPATKDDFDPFPGYLDRLITGERPMEIFQGRYGEFHDTLWLKSGFRINMRSGITQKECEESTAKPVPDHPSFVMEYHLSMKKYDRGAGTLKTLSDRWKRFGNFVHVSNGDISYKSKTIVFETSDRN